MKPVSTMGARVAYAALHPAEWRALMSAGRDRVFPALAYPDYARLWSGNLGSMVAFWMQSIAQGVLAIELTGSPFILGLLAFFRSIPMLFVSPYGGLLADRFNRVRVMVSAQVLMSATALAIALLVATGRIEVWHLALSSFALGMSFAISMPARNALISDVVPRETVSNAIGLNSATMNLARVVGPALAGVLIGIIGIAGAYFVQLGGYVWSTLNVVRIRAGGQHPRAQGSALGVLREGVSYVLHDKNITALLALTMAPALFSMPMLTLLPAFVLQDLNETPDRLGLLMGALGVGALIGSMLIVIYANFRRKGMAVMVSLLLYSLLVVALSFTRSMLAACLVIAVAGFFQSVYMALNQTIIQLIVPSRLRGRVLSIWMISWGLMPLGLLPISAIAESAGTPLAMGLGGVLSAAVVLGVMAWRRSLWSLQPDATDSAAAEYGARGSKSGSPVRSA